MYQPEPLARCRFRAQSVAVYDLAANGNLRLGARPCQRTHSMSTAQQLRRQPASHETGRSGEEDFT
jgi:hypothetical protein